jgi:hypothetical protein
VCYFSRYARKIAHKKIGKYLAAAAENAVLSRGTTQLLKPGKERAKELKEERDENVPS